MLSMSKAAAILAALLLFLGQLASAQQAALGGQHLAKFPVAHLHVGFSNLTFCYGYLSISPNLITYEVQRTEQGRDLDKDKRHSFNARPDTVQVLGTAVLKAEHGPEGLELRVGGKTLSLFYVSDWSKLDVIKSENRPIIQPVFALRAAILNYNDASHFAPATEEGAENKNAGPAPSNNVELHPGMSKAEVITLLGQPEKTIEFGKKTILKYRDMTVELEDDKVIDVKTT